MQDLPDDVEKGVLGEHLSHKLDILTEGMTSLLKDVPSIKADVETIKSDVTELKDDMKLVKDAVREHVADRSMHR